MTAQIVDSKPQTQSDSIWNKPTARAKIGDYFHIPYTPVMQVVDLDVLASGQVWLLLKPTTGSYTQEWVLEPETDPMTPQQPEPLQEMLASASGLAGDSITSQLLSPNDAPQQLEPKPELTPEADPEFQQGRIHGQQDATARLHPIYTKPVDAYATGYLAGYSSYCPSQQPRVSQPVEWSVTYNQKWGWYEVWVSNRWIGRADSHDEAERVATKRIALDKMILRQNQAVMKAYAG